MYIKGKARKLERFAGELNDNIAWVLFEQALKADCPHAVLDYRVIYCMEIEY